MFNENLKKDFITNYTTKISTEKTCVRLFRDISKYEKDLNKDFSAMTVDEISTVLKAVTGLRNNTRITSMQILKDYSLYCVKNGITGASTNITNVGDFVSDKTKECMVCSPTQLQKYLDKVFAPESELTVDNTNRALFWLAFSGIRECDADKITSKNVDLENMVIRYNKREYPIYREALQCIKNCTKLMDFAYKHPNYPDKDSHMMRVAGNSILRGVRDGATVTSKITNISARIRRLRDSGVDMIKMSYNRIYMSGIFYRVYELERAGIDPDFSEAVELYMEGREYKKSKVRDIKKLKISDTKRNYLKDYERWKLAFDVR